MSKSRATEQNRGQQPHTTPSPREPRPKSDRNRSSAPALGACPEWKVRSGHIPSLSNASSDSAQSKPYPIVGVKGGAEPCMLDRGSGHAAGGEWHERNGNPPGVPCDSGRSGCPQPQRDHQSGPDRLRRARPRPSHSEVPRLAGVRFTAVCDVNANTSLRAQTRRRRPRRGLQRLQEAARKQGHRRGHHRHQSAVARAADDRRLPRRQGRLPREAARQLHWRRSLRHRGRTQVQPHRAGRHPTTHPATLSRGRRTHPGRQARRNLRSARLGLRKLLPRSRLTRRLPAARRTRLELLRRPFALPGLQPEHVLQVRLRLVQASPAPAIRWLGACTTSTSCSGPWA